MPIELMVVTPEGQAFHDQVEQVVLPGTEGEFGVLSGHEAFLTGLQIGEMRIFPDGGDPLFAATSGGWAEVADGHVSVMVGACEFSGDIDVERAERARERAQRQLEEMRATEDGEKLYQTYQEAFSRAITRLNVSKKRA